MQGHQISKDGLEKKVEEYMCYECYSYDNNKQPINSNHVLYPMCGRIKESHWVISKYHWVIIQLSPSKLSPSDNSRDVLNMIQLLVILINQIHQMTTWLM